MLCEDLLDGPDSTFSEAQIYLDSALQADYFTLRIKDLYIKEINLVGDEPDGTKALYDDIELLIFDTYEGAIYYRDNLY